MTPALLLLFTACDRGPVRPPVRPPAEFDVRGIDVSHHQGRVDWERVAASGEVDFVFVKATEGRSHVDRRYRANWVGARDAGLKVGAYHYFSLCRTGASQADHFISVVPKESDALPAVVDIELDGRCNRGTRLEDAAAAVSAWVDRVGAHYGVQPIVYSSSSFHRSHLAHTGLDAPMWLAAYSKMPRQGGWAFWQYTDRARVPGIRGPVDGDVFSGSLEALEDLRRR